MKIGITFCVISFCSWSCFGADYEARLYNELMLNYSRYARPVHRHTEALEVKFGLSPTNIEKLDGKSHTLKMYAWTNMAWRDYQLQWNPQQQDGVRSVVLPADNIWNPNILLYNSVGEGMKKTSDGNVHVQHDGSVTYKLPVVLESRCSVDLSEFPFDTQSCLLRFGSDVYNEEEVNLTLNGGRERALDMTNYVSSVEYSVIGHSSERGLTFLPCCAEAYPYLTFNLTLQRLSSTESHLLIASMVILSLMLPVLFILPPDSSEKLTFGVGLLIAHVVLFGQVENFTSFAQPAKIPRIAVYCLSNLILLGFSLFFSAIIVNCSGRKTRNAPVPDVLRKVFLDFCCRLLRVSRGDFRQNVSSPETAEKSSSEEAPKSVGLDESNEARMKAKEEWTLMACVLDRLFLVVCTVTAIIVALILAL